MKSIALTNRPKGVKGAVPHGDKQNRTGLENKNLKPILWQE